MSRELTWQLFLDEVVPQTLSEAGVEQAQVDRTVVDIADRARSYAACGRQARLALRTLAIEDVAQFHPEQAPVGVKADTAVVIRNSLLEDLHANGPVGSEHLFRLTYLGCGALNQWLTERANTADAHPPAGLFSPVLEHPRGWAALQAAGTAVQRGGRVGFRLPNAPVPPVPQVTAAATVRQDGVHIRSALSGLDDTLVSMMRRTEAGELNVWFTVSLSRYSRDASTIALLLDFALSRGRDVLTTNLLIRPGEVFVRKQPLLTADVDRPLAGLRDVRGLAGLHAKYARTLAAQAG